MTPPAPTVGGLKWLADHRERADSPSAGGPRECGVKILATMNPVTRLRWMGDRLAPSAEVLARAVAERAVELVVSALDMNALLDRVDVNAVLEQVDVNGLVTRVDLGRLLAGVDVNELVRQVDVEAVIKRIDLDAVVDQLDIDAIVQRIDVDALVRQTDLGAAIAKSSSGIAGNALDVARSQAVGLDEFLARWVARLRRHQYPGPPELPDPPELPGSSGRAGDRGGVMTTRGARARSSRSPALNQVSLQGHCAGFASRFLTFVVDEIAANGVFALVLAAISFMASVLTGNSIQWNRNALWLTLLFAAWQFVYFAYSWGASGKTFGMAVFGIRVVRNDGTSASWPEAVVRTLAFPLSFLALGLGFLGILLGGQRRALHDVIAGTAVVYSWDARASRLRFLLRG